VQLRDVEPLRGCGYAQGVQRREFLEGALATGSLSLLEACSRAAQVRSAAPASALPPVFAPKIKALADLALSAARDAGATYADIRIADYRTQSLRTREQRVVSVRDDESRGFGVRVIAQGTWGFAASSAMHEAEVVRVAQQAVAMAKQNSVLQREPVQLGAPQANVAVWSTPIRRDAFEVSLEEKLERLLSINALALKQPGVSFVDSQMSFVREHKFFASSEGSAIEQTLQRLHPSFSLTSVDQKRGSFESRDSYTDPRAMGYEYVDDYPWEQDVLQAASDARAKHDAPSVEPGKRDLILHPTHLWLTIHESIGHSTELDRALGLEANYAGTSFLTPDKLGKFQLGSEHVNIVAEKTATGSLATSGYDDDGMKTEAWPLVETRAVRRLPADPRPGALDRQDPGPRLFVRAELEGRAFSAHAQREPRARYGSVISRPADRQHRLGHLDQGPRQLQHRSPALQFPVRRADLLADRTRAYHRLAEGRRLSVQHARVLGGLRRGVQRRRVLRGRFVF
jgi:predicted Zn-dependent protease